MTTIGSDLVGTLQLDFACESTPCTVVPTELDGASLAAPVDGVVVRWNVRSHCRGAPFALRVIRPSGAQYTGVGTSVGVEVRNDVPGVELTTFKTRLPIKTGDFLGIELPVKGGPDLVCRNSIQFGSFTTAGRYVEFANPASLADGDTRSPSLVVSAGYEWHFNGEIEADGDRDGFGDETQDPCPTQAGTEDGCPRPKVPVAKTDRRAPRQTVQITRRQDIDRLSLIVKTDEPAAVAVTAFVRSSVNRSRVVRFVSVDRRLKPGISRRVRLKLRRRDVRTVRRAIAQGRKLTARVKTVASDGSANRSTKRYTVRLVDRKG